VLFLLANASASESPGPQTLKVAAAADLTYVMPELARTFEKEHPGTKVKVSFGASGVFAGQIAKGAPFDVFFSADASFPEDLEKKGLAEEPRRYGFGKLVIYALKPSPTVLEVHQMATLTQPWVKKIAIANPRTAPYGRAAEAAIKSIGADLSSELVVGENVAQAAQFVDSGAAQVGLIAESLALGPGPLKRGQFWEIPQNLYPPIEQKAVVLKRASDPQLARAFLDSVSKQGPLLEHFGLRVK
jgi:molybdate transport system substrate-binding protein